MGAPFNVGMFRVFQSGANINQGHAWIAGGAFPPADAETIVASCANIRAAVEHQDQVSEPWWYLIIGVAKFCENGNEVAHEWSRNHRDYDRNEAQQKIDNWKATGATRCVKLADHSPGSCESCPHLGKINSPIVLGYPSVNAPCPKWVMEVNNGYAWIEEAASIYRLEYGNFIEPAKFRIQHDNHTVEIGFGKNTKVVGIGTAWLTSKHRRQHKRLVLHPNEGSVTSDNCMNTWAGYAVAAAAGNIKRFLKLLLRLVPDRKARRYMLSWLAHLVQHPEIKMHTSLVCWSQETGVGKNLLFECITAIIGPTHSLVIGEKQLESDFNGWAHRKVFIIGDEVCNSDRRKETERLKSLITGTTLPINEKYQPAFIAPNFLNFVFLSNHNDALFVDDRDRRYFVWEIAAGKLPEKQIKAFTHWRDNGGLEALHHFLLSLDITGFNPKAPAPMTEAKQQMVQDSRSDLESWIADMMASNISQMLGRELATANELGTRYSNDTGHKKPSAKTIVGAVKKLGGQSRVNQVRLANGAKARVLALGRPAYWKQRPEPDWAAEMAQPFKPI
ncbi:MAG: DUF5906 domain-containing protein [Betaproteobacteria bacterium]|nr:DUF5906 domain-containing protein [Betaproteobacteria bacterium]